MARFSNEHGIGESPRSSEKLPGRTKGNSRKGRESPYDRGRSIELGGPSSGEPDVLDISGTATLAETLDIRVITDSNPSSGFKLRFPTKTLRRPISLVK